ncbi:LysR family transcriptional regulator [Roseomonas eburnea]|uniref:LysR family transcriptional regulator n=1 Tax=Neoroseomonas eburnea TaxID=1346889 RepID=A0A9X9XE56_9PROT|nr:LysR substrate-binding domain-containing protein [Neoroseomonas eburnea]MBR0681992.1 LysR family transcriptional regulator [Neoroseomonas eburnea]
MSSAPVRTPPLRMVEAFEALARLGSRSAAAAELNVTPGAISKQLRALERWVGQPLLEEDGRDGAFTAEGRGLAQSVTAGLAQIRDGLDALRPRDTGRVPLNILAPATFAMKWLVPRLHRVDRAAPQLQVTLRPTNTGDDWLSFPHHAAIRRDGFVPQGYDTMPLLRETLTAYVAPSLARAASSPEAVPLCESETRPGDLDRWLAAAGVGRIGQARRRHAHFYIAYEAALAGAGLIVAPTLLAANDVAAGRLVAPWPYVAIPGTAYAFVHPATAAMRKRVAPFLTWLKAELEQLDEGPGGGAPKDPAPA